MREHESRPFSFVFSNSSLAAAPQSLTKGDSIFPYPTNIPSMKDHQFSATPFKNFRERYLK
jgi:hypothetical protein